MNGSKATDPGRRAEDQGAVEESVLAFIRSQEDAWNRGDLASLIDAYWDDPRVRYASGDEVIHGIADIERRFVEAYPDREAMGRLAFHELECSVVGADEALVFGRWRMDRHGSVDTGLLTVHCRIHDGRWCIVSDHTSSA